MKSNLFYLDLLLIVLIVVVLIFIIYKKNKNETFVQSEIPGVNDGNIYNYGIAVGDWVHWWPISYLVFNNIKSENATSYSENNYNNNTVLTALSDNTIGISSKIVPSDDSQLWMITSEGLIINKKTNMAVTIPNLLLSEAENMARSLHDPNNKYYQAMLTPITGNINQRFTILKGEIFIQSIPFQLVSMPSVINSNNNSSITNNDPTAQFLSQVSGTLFCIPGTIPATSEFSIKQGTMFALSS